PALQTFSRIRFPAQQLTMKTIHYQITSMSDIVRDLSRLGWTDERIGTELGMDQDEVLRLKQISGLTELFQEENFSPAWTVR
ncbi:hypothetical protein ACUOFC_22135, partial [Escherichia sp. TWPC-MK]